MRILNIITGLGLGGAENMLYKLSSEFVRNDHIVHVASLSGRGHFSEKLERRRIRVTNVNLKKFNIFRIKRIFDIIKEYKPSVIQGWMYHGNLFSYFLRYFLNFKVPLVWNVRQSLDNYDHDGFFTKMIIRCNARKSKNVTKIIYNSVYSMRQHEEFGFDKSKSIFIPNGFDLDEMIQLSSDEKINRKILNINDEDFIIINNGRHHKTKDQETFIKAANIVSRNVKNIKFLMLGEKVDFKNKNLVNLIDPNYIKNFLLIGKVDNVFPYLKMADIYTSTSIAEAFSNSIGEALFMGLPCVVTKVGDSAIIVGEPELIIPHSDPEALAEKWLKLYKMNKSERIKLGEFLKEKAIERYSLGSVFKKYHELYKELAI